MQQWPHEGKQLTIKNGKMADYLVTPVFSQIVAMTVWKWLQLGGGPNLIFPSFKLRNTFPL